MGRELAHDFSHAERVALLAKKIAQQERLVNPELAEIAGLLHDIGLGIGDRQKHGQIGAKMAAKFLKNECHSYFSAVEIKKIAYAISWHNRKLATPKQSDLLDVVVDADTLDLLGAVGIWRGITALDSAQFPNCNDVSLNNASFDDYNGKLRDVRATNNHGVDAQLNFQIRSAEILSTATAKKLAEPLLSTMRNFRYMLVHELNTGTYG